MDELLRAVQLVGDALALVADGALEAWAASNNLDLNIEELRQELMLVKATLEMARGKQIDCQAMKGGLPGKLLASAYDARELLDDLNYFRTHNKIRVHCDAATATEHIPTARASGKFTCLSSRWMPKLGKLLPCSSSPHVQDESPGHSTLLSRAPQIEHAEEAQIPRFRAHVSERMKCIVDELQPVRAQVAQILRTCVHHTTLNTDNADICADEGDLIGIEHARDELMQILCKGGNQLNILSVVGFGGLGKTTLAKAVYHRIKVQFDCTAFVSISQNPDMQKVLMHILCDLGKQNYLENRAKDEKQLIHEIRKFLQTKRYLIVLDDIWSENIWDIISLSLLSNVCGSRVIVTTRVDKIAEQCCSENKDLIYKIMPLGYQNSRSLFLDRCFGSKDSCHESKIADALREVDEILKICGGMPLAIIGIASAFSQVSIKEPCQEMMKSLHSARGDLHCVEELTRILSYSYFDLPDALRACLLYLAASAKNERIQRDSLVRKWIAEGLIPEDKDNREEVATRYFDELIDRNVIQPVKYVYCLGEETYEITYMMLYVLRLLLQKENFATILSEPEPYVEVMPMRLFMQCSDSELLISTERVNLTNACSVTMVGPANWVSFKHLKYVQVLDLDGCEDLDNSAMHDICLLVKLKYLSLNQTQVTEIPREISNLQHLETLAIRNTQITTLPPEISELQNLETLDVSRTQLRYLPAEISKLQNLETLDVRHTLVQELPKEVLQLPKLKHLHFGQSGCFGVKLPVGIDQMKSVRVMGNVDSRECSESAMKEIGKLIEIRELELVLYDGPADMEWSDKLLSSVGKCSKLKSLTIYGDSNPRDELAFESPIFTQLEKLNVVGRFVKVPRWIGQLRTLALLVIRVFKLEEKDLETIGGLPCLNVLELALVAVPRKQVAITSSAGFPRLEVFCFDCRLPWVSFEEKAMPNLEHLQLKLYSGPADKVPSGIMLLERLSVVMLLCFSQHLGSDCVFETLAVVREDAASHANLIELSINGDREIFLPNRSAHRGVASADTVITEAESVQVVASE